MPQAVNCLTIIVKEYNLCGDGPVNTDVLKHHGSDNSSPSSRAKLNVAKLLYKQGMAKRATRLVQDHHRRGLSPPVPSCQTMVDVDPSFATPNAPSADWSRLSRSLFRNIKEVYAAIADHFGINSALTRTNKRKAKMIVKEVLLRLEEEEQEEQLLD
ncbi:hypothetical protein AURANDRAFT_68892 [Aureococcus anophagefferens]|uniref:Uncharacterized protein n=1 Tax=Aureococcus anophagefferens TaxID=44056 RepID=F0YR32_AURAN|nr:hypothetical protein AURANDRAFT_68892 [Aureococcus anophagefferens]EGB02428.1 hypothetical protein AURANDRAFT_68892 [Aureococcus anophagefferens]|eukprot:XP_009042874.1 hypothetical protein AURANDRAFT_68892 [Aureococcus anophagefferens]